MEQLQAFDDKIVNLILQYSLLDLSAPDRITADEVYAAAELALQISTRNEAGHTTQHPPSGATVPRPARNDPKRKPPARETQAPKGRQAMTTQSRVIGAEERREILLDSDSDAETESKTKGEPCIACAGGSGEKRRLPCGCNYCAPCLRRCIRSGLRNEESWPPRCHERLTEEDVRRTRRPGLLRLWRQMATEWDSPASGRLYCSRPACAAFIPRAEGQTGEVRCGACGEGTCGGCRRSWHPGLPCGEEEEEEQLMDMMDQCGYASCNNCRRIVDLREGCNHITCGCGHQFCYLCGDPWKTCLCPRHGTATGRRPARQRAQQYHQSHDEIPFAPRALGFGTPEGGRRAEFDMWTGRAPPPGEWFPGGVVREQDLDWLVPPPGDWVPGAEGRRDMGGFVPPHADWAPGGERLQVPEDGLVAPPAGWVPPQPPAGAAIGNNNAVVNNNNNGLVFIDDGTQPRDPGRTYVYDWEVTPGRQPWVRRYPPGHLGDRGPDATVQTRLMAQGERVHPAVMPRGDGGPMVFLPQVDSSDEYDSYSEEESEEERVRRERRKRRERRGRNRQEPRWITEPRRASDPPRQAQGSCRVQNAPRTPDPQVRYDVTYTRNGRLRIREAPCAHHFPTQWTPSRAASPPCLHCRGGHPNRELWRCVGCHAQSCRRHMARYGLPRQEAEREVEEIDRRTRGTGFRFASFIGIGPRL